MGCSFNHVVVPDSVKKVGELRKFYTEYRDGLLMDYGEEFEGYSGDMAVDDGSLVVRRDLKLDYDGGFDDLSEIFDDLVKMCEEAGASKWGPSVAFRVGGRWVICGFYSD
jgi:hypothetical protein